MYITGFTTYTDAAKALDAFIARRGPAAMTMLPDCFVIDTLSDEPVQKDQQPGKFGPKTVFNSYALALTNRPT